MGRRGQRIEGDNEISKKKKTKWAGVKPRMSKESVAGASKHAKSIQARKGGPSFMRFWCARTRAVEVQNEKERREKEIEDEKGKKRDGMDHIGRL